MLRAVKIRLYPNKEQATMFNKLLGCYRVVNTCYDEPWNSKVASLNITRWLYIDDLLLKK